MQMPVDSCYSLELYKCSCHTAQGPLSLLMQWNYMKSLYLVNQFALKWALQERHLAQSLSSSLLHVFIY